MLFVKGVSWMHMDTPNNSSRLISLRVLFQRKKVVHLQKRPK